MTNAPFRRPIIRSSMTQGFSDLRLGTFGMLAAIILAIAVPFGIWYVQN